MKSSTSRSASRAIDLLLLASTLLGKVGHTRIQHPNLYGTKTLAAQLLTIAALPPDELLG